MSLAATLQGLPATWFPLFDLAHFSLAALAVRKDVGLQFSRQKPLACWIATMTACFAGSIIANPLLGKPILGAVSNETTVLLASIVWWAVFYSPADLVYSLLTNQALYIPICVAKEIYRAKKVLGGIADGRKVFPDNELLMVAVGLIKGNGSGLLKPLTRLVCGSWEPARSELLALSATSRECFLAAILLVADQAGSLPALLAGDALYLAIVSTFLLVKLSSTLTSSTLDPTRPLEQAAAWLALGGLWDSMGEKQEKVE